MIKILKMLNIKKILVLILIRTNVGEYLPKMNKSCYCNTLSEVVEAVCMATENPFEVISSEDMLSRVIACYAKIENMAENENWSLDQDWILLGSDVKSLFPSLSAELTGKAVKRQFKKSTIIWNTIVLKLVAKVGFKNDHRQ